MKDITIKQYSSVSFSYDENEIKKLIPVLEAYLSVISNGLYSTVEVEEVTKPLPNESDKSFEKIQLIHYMVEMLTNDSVVFILEKFDSELNKNMPAVMALFSKIENTNQYLLEFVETHEDFKGCNFANQLLKESFKYLGSTGALAINAHVNEKNKASINLNESLGTVFKATRNPATPDVIDYVHIVNKDLAKKIKAMQSQKEPERF